MTHTIVKGSSFDVQLTIWSTWTGDAATSTLANLTGATGNVYFKQRPTDSDASALFTKAVSLVDPVNGTAKATVLAADTNERSQQKIVFEGVIKMADGTYIRTGVEDLVILPNVGKTLF